MAYYANVADGVVGQVVVLDEVNETEGVARLGELLGGQWIKTVEDASLRGVFAAPGYRYDAVRDVFVPPSWVLTDDVWAPPPIPPGWTLIDGVWTAPPAEPLP